MTLSNATRVALHALGRNKLRSVLTALGIIIGVGSLIALLAIGHGARAQVADRVASLGENVIQVTAGSLSRSAVKLGLGTSVGLSVQDAEAIRNEIPDAVAVSPEVKIKSQVVSGNRNWSPDVYGDSTDYFAIRRWTLSDGQFFTEQDERAGAKVAVIGQEVVEELFVEDEDPIGQIIRIRNVPFTVVGVLAPKGASASGSDQDDSIIVPYTTAMKQLLKKETGLRRIYIQAASLEALPTVEEKVTSLLRQRHGIDEDDEEDFKVRSQLEIAESATATSRTMTLLLSLIASVSLIVGGIGIMNIMLVSVTERTREIGIRLAIGAHRRDILRQFLIEAVMLSAMGGLIGVATGASTARLLTVLVEWPTLVSPDAVLIAFVFSALVGIFFGFYPARKASRLDPIEALRYE
jgi:putative ABC transport system permease protein